MRPYSTQRFLLLLSALALLVSIPALDVAQGLASQNTNTGAKTRTTNTNRRRRRTTRRRPATTTTTAAKPTTVSVPVGTNLKVRLNDTLSSKTSRVGDKFTVTVIDPVKYNEATVRGHVASILKSGKVSGRTTMNLDFDSITTSDERKGVLHGLVVRVYGQGASADNEGGVQSGSRGKQAVKRGAVGGAAGAIIGGIAGGGKGAAIGLIIGGAGGAGSLAIQGSKELKLENGTELLVQVTR